MQIIRSGIDGIKVQLWEAITRYRTRISENGLRGRQSMEWTGSIRWIHNPVQSRRIWIGLDQKFANSPDSGLDWIEKCVRCNAYLEI